MVVGVGVIAALSGAPAVGAVLIVLGIGAEIYFRTKEWWEHGWRERPEPVPGAPWLHGEVWAWL
ncbi:MAG: hypothetical protein M0R80_28110 [Proteobacteria bacterium]|nr:hypothetical protein [Pseudomonadota bacterium]